MRQIATWLAAALLAPGAVGCQPRAYYDVCETSDDCPRSLDCLPAPEGFIEHQGGDTGDLDWDLRVCSRRCSSERDCPIRSDRHCGTRYDCEDGVCGSNAGCV